MAKRNFYCISHTTIFFIIHLNFHFFYFFFSSSHIFPCYFSFMLYVRAITNGSTVLPFMPRLALYKCASVYVYVQRQTHRIRAKYRLICFIRKDVERFCFFLLTNIKINKITLNYEMKCIGRRRNEGVRIRISEVRGNMRGKKGDRNRNKIRKGILFLLY
jgi:hypothetical protein